MRKLLEIASDVDLVMLLLGEHAGLRISEMCKLKWSDFDKSHGTLEFVGKGNKSATVTVSKSLHDALLALEQNEVYRQQNAGYILPFRNRHTGKNAWRISVDKQRLHRGVFTRCDTRQERRCGPRVQTLRTLLTTCVTAI